MLPFSFGLCPEEIYTPPFSANHDLDSFSESKSILSLGPLTRMSVMLKLFFLGPSNPIRYSADSSGTVNKLGPLIFQTMSITSAEPVRGSMTTAAKAMAPTVRRRVNIVVSVKTGPLRREQSTLTADAPQRRRIGSNTEISTVGPERREEQFLASLGNNVRGPILEHHFRERVPDQPPRHRRRHERDERHRDRRPFEQPDDRRIRSRAFPSGKPAEYGEGQGEAQKSGVLAKSLVKLHPRRTQDRRVHARRRRRRRECLEREEDGVKPPTDHREGEDAGEEHAGGQRHGIWGDPPSRRNRAERRPREPTHSPDNGQADRDEDPIEDQRHHRLEADAEAGQRADGKVGIDLQRQLEEAARDEADDFHERDRAEDGKRAAPDLSERRSARRHGGGHDLRKASIGRRFAGERLEHVAGRREPPTRLRLERALDDCDERIGQVVTSVAQTTPLAALVRACQRVERSAVDWKC